jgi:hypothetical protein
MGGIRFLGVIAVPPFVPGRLPLSAAARRVVTKIIIVNIFIIIAVMTPKG